MTPLERVARAYWNKLSHASRTRLEAQTTTSPPHKYVSSPILWDDDDMLEADRQLVIEATRAAITALAEAVSDEMVEALREGMVGRASSARELFGNSIRAAILAALEQKK